MIKIAFIHNRFPAGGAERITIDVIRYLKSVGGYEMYVYASKIADSMLSDEIRSMMTIRQIPDLNFSRGRTRAIIRNVTNDKIDVLVQVAKTDPGIDKIVAATGVKTVMAFHDAPFGQRHAIMARRRSGVLRKILWHLYNRKRYEDGSLALSKAVSRTKRDYYSCDAYTVLCQPYKLEIENTLCVNPDESHIYAIENPEYPVRDVNYDKENIVLFCGRLVNWHKRLDRLFRIWKKIQDKKPDWRLMIVGDGKDKGMLMHLANELDLQRVSFEGFRMNVGDYYRKASIVAMTSDTEGWPLALTEAQAHGCITIAFDCCSGIKEILGHDEGCGVAVPSFDEDLYAEELLRIVSMDEVEKDKMRRNAVDRRNRFAPEVISEKWKRLFDELCIDKSKVNRYESI